MKAYLIDPFEKTVTEVDVEPGVEAIYQLINAGTFDLVRWHDHVLYVDDEGLYVEGQKAFGIQLPTSPVCQYVLAGKALLVGPTNDEGDDTQPTISLDQLKAAIEWDQPVPTPSFKVTSWND